MADLPCWLQMGSGCFPRLQTTSHMQYNEKSGSRAEAEKNRKEYSLNFNPRYSDFSYVYHEIIFMPNLLVAAIPSVKYLDGYVTPTLEVSRKCDIFYRVKFRSTRLPKGFFLHKVRKFPAPRPPVECLHESPRPENSVLWKLYSNGKEALGEQTVRPLCREGHTNRRQGNGNTMKRSRC